MFDQSRGKLRVIIATSVLLLSLGSVSAPARADHGADIIGPAIAFLALGTILQQGHQHRHYKYYQRYRHHDRQRGHGKRRYHGQHGYHKKHHRRHSHSHGDYYAYKRKQRKQRKHW